ncbi:DUF6281 family protein [Streptomyces sp. NPDC058052]|uniref:DUF6281 family protein n=1 Tax=Streptomyces sp. NPDC058052 TaxID=3346316 RepID=UPI0036E5F293
MSCGRREGSSAFQVVYDHRTDTDAAHADFEVGRRPGSATKPSCDDTGTGSGSAEQSAQETA